MFTNFKALKFIHNWRKQSLPSILNNSFHYAKNVLSHNTRYASQNNLYKSRFRTNMGKQTISDMATDIWQNIPSVLKELNTYILKKKRPKVSASKTVWLLSQLIVAKFYIHINFFIPDLSVFFSFHYGFCHCVCLWVRAKKITYNKITSNVISLASN